MLLCGAVAPSLCVSDSWSIHLSACPPAWLLALCVIARCSRFAPLRTRAGGCVCAAENDTPSAIDMASSDDELGDDTTGGLSKVESFSNDPTIEIMRLKALLSQRDDELDQKTTLLAQRESLLRQSKGARTHVFCTRLCCVGGHERNVPPSMDMCAQRSLTSSFRKTTPSRKARVGPGHRRDRRAQAWDLRRHTLHARSQSHLHAPQQRSRQQSNPVVALPP